MEAITLTWILADAYQLSSTARRLPHEEILMKARPVPFLQPRAAISVPEGGTCGGSGTGGP